MDTVLECENDLRDNLEVTEKLLEEFRSAWKEWNGYFHGKILIIQKNFYMKNIFDLSEIISQLINLPNQNHLKFWNPIKNKKHSEQKEENKKKAIIIQSILFKEKILKIPRKIFWGVTHMHQTTS